MRISGLGGLQGDKREGQTGMKVGAGREETVPSCTGTAESQRLIGFWGTLADILVQPHLWV